MNFWILNNNNNMKMAEAETLEEANAIAQKSALEYQQTYKVAELIIRSITTPKMAAGE